jgi:competence protein ComEC
MFSRENRPLAALREAIGRAGVPIRELAAGDRLAGRGPWRIEVLHPVRRGGRATDNADSLVLLVEHAGRRILLTGDLEPPGLGDVLAEEPIDCDVLLVPHHGSHSSSPPGLVAWSRPEWAVISGSLSRDPAGTEAAYREAGVRVLNTGRVGAVGVAWEGFGDLETWGFGEDGSTLARSASEDR